MKNSIKYILVLITGVLLGAFLISFINIKKKETLYWTLEEDCNIEDVGLIKKGTKLRVDKSMASFTRCILYLNLKTPEVTHKLEDKGNLVIPYWLTPIKDSLVKNK